MFRSLAIVAATVLAAPAFADGHSVDLTATGDVDAGEAAFRQCVSCHVVMNEAGDTLAGRAAKTGPNLYGIIGGQFGTVEDYRYYDINQLASEMLSSTKKSLSPTCRTPQVTCVRSRATRAAAK